MQPFARAAPTALQSMKIQSGCLLACSIRVRASEYIRECKVKPMIPEGCRAGPPPPPPPPRSLDAWQAAAALANMCCKQLHEFSDVVEEVCNLPFSVGQRDGNEELCLVESSAMLMLQLGIQFASQSENASRFRCSGTHQILAGRGTAPLDCSCKLANSHAVPQILPATSSL